MSYHINEIGGVANDLDSDVDEEQIVAGIVAALYSTVERQHLDDSEMSKSNNAGYRSYQNQVWRFSGRWWTNLRFFFTLFFN
ncbi:MAG: hypothetical protein M1483_08260 [Actinobacteria bacterium]|nr:hypothetical protein [Actinomycetota bacterium]MCL6105598.1 hypothetical protein [Actinomycetota bacterium]